MFRSWYEKWKMWRDARKILSDKEASIDALIHARGILYSLSERKSVCRQCFQVYDQKHRSFSENFQVRSILMIPDRELNPMLCDACFNNVLSAYNPQATNVGTSNAGPANLALRKLN